MMCGNAADRQLPDPLTLADGRQVTSAELWTAERRPELLALFRTHVYGRAPIGRPATLAFTVTTTPGMMGGAATRKQVAITFAGPGGTGTINLLLFVPTAAQGPVPAFVLICNRDVTNIDPTRETQSPFWPAEELVARGYAAAAFHVADADPDHDDGFNNGVHGIYDEYSGPRPADAWATISAWAWGASRCMDYLETDLAIDAQRVAVVGHSRGGKTALWCGAQDTRFALTISNDSGCTGAAVTRGKQGETIEMITRSFPHWFCANYASYARREAALPVDQHALVALLAPRLVYVASAVEDLHADPASEFLSCVEATRVYALFGLRGITAAQPAVNRPLHDGSIAYHVRPGGHDLTLYDWTCFMEYADKHLR